MANEIRSRSNFLFGAISDNPLLIGATTINSSTFTSLPVIDATNHLILVLDPNGTNGAPEIVKVTAHTVGATSVTVQRAQDGSNARQHGVNTTWYHAPVVSDYNFTDIAALSTNRPASPTVGQLIYETDTDTYTARSAGPVWQTVMQMGAWTSYTPTLTQNVTVTKTVNYAKFTRMGRTIHVTCFLTVTGAGTAANQVLITLPVASTGTIIRVGIGQIYDVSANTMYGGIAECSVNASTVRLWPTSADGGDVLGNNVFTAGLAVNDQVHLVATYEAAS